MTDSSGDQRWYIRIRGRVLGPFDLAQLQLLKSRGQFTRLHEVSTDRRNWQPAAVLEKHSEPPPADDTPEDSPESSPQPAAAPVVQDQPLEWYYAQGQTQMGPVSLNKLQELMDYGQITKKDLAWSEGLPEWQPICKIPALQSICESASGRQPTTKRWRGRLRTQRVLGVLAVLVAVCLLALVGSIWFGQDAKPVPQSGTASADGADSSEAADEQAEASGSHLPQDPAVADLPDEPPAGADVTTNSPPEPERPTRKTGEQPQAPTTGAAVPLSAGSTSPADLRRAVDPSADTSRPGVISDVYDEVRIRRSVGLVVSTLHMVARGGKEIEFPTSSGTCFIVSPEGHALTNRHVVRSVQEMSRATRTLRELETELKLETTPVPRLFAFLDGKISKVDVVFVSDDFDMAVLKLNRKCEDYFALSDQPNLERASSVIALGFPGAANHPLSTDEEVETQKRELLAIREGRPLAAWFKPRDFEYSLTRGDVNRISIEDGGRAWIQHSAIIAHGNSGGPLTFADGTVVGINTSVTRDGQSGQNYYYALSTAQLRGELASRVPGLIWRNPSVSSSPPKSVK